MKRERLASADGLYSDKFINSFISPFMSTAEWRTIPIYIVVSRMLYQGVQILFG